MPSFNNASITSVLCDSLKKLNICVATISPTSCTSTSASIDASRIASRVSKCAAKLAAVASPTSRIPSAYRNFAKVVCLDASKEDNNLLADFSAMRSKPTTSPSDRVKKSAGL